jgi:RNA polymerase sigma-70 factor (ECF subfamily)
MTLIAGGDASAYRALSERYLGRILRYSTRLLADPAEADDVAQETFLRLWKHADRWQPKAKPSTWLYRVAHNLCVDRLRVRRAGDADALERHSVGDRPSSLLARKQLAAEVQAALEALPERQRAAIVLSHYEGLSNPEAADVLGVGVEAVESLLSRGRRALKQRLQPLHARSEGEET